MLDWLQKLINMNVFLLCLKQPSHGKLKLANSCWQTQVSVCERRKTVGKHVLFVCQRVCRLFLRCSHTLTWVCPHEFANFSLLCEGRFKVLVRYGERRKVLVLGDTFRSVVKKEFGIDSEESIVSVKCARMRILTMPKKKSGGSSVTQRTQSLLLT